MIDSEALTVAWLKSAFPTVPVSTETDTTLQDDLPAIRVGQIGGIDVDYVIDEPLLMVDVFGASRAAAKTFAEQVRDSLILHMPGQHVGAGNVRSVRTIRAPSWTPWDNTSLRRYSATYQLVITAY